MNMDARIKPKVPPQFGCHSELDKYRRTPPPMCKVEFQHEENACKHCTRRIDDDDKR